MTSSTHWRGWSRPRVRGRPWSRRSGRGRCRCATTCRCSAARRTGGCGCSESPARWLARRRRWRRGWACPSTGTRWRCSKPAAPPIRPRSRGSSAARPGIPGTSLPETAGAGWPTPHAWPGCSRRCARPSRQCGSGPRSCPSGCIRARPAWRSFPPWGWRARRPPRPCGPAQGPTSFWGWPSCCRARAPRPMRRSCCWCWPTPS